MKTEEVKRKIPADVIERYTIEIINGEMFIWNLDTNSWAAINLGRIKQIVTHKNAMKITLINTNDHIILGRNGKFGTNIHIQ